MAEDHAIVRAGLRMLLERVGGLEVCGEAGDGAETLQLVENLRPDLLVLDISLPKLSGLRVLQRLKAQQPGCRVVLLTAHQEEELREQALRAGADGFVIKGSSPGNLIAVIQKVLGLEGNPAGLTDRQLDVLRLIGEGLTSREIAESLTLSHHTVERHRTNIALKLNVTRRGELVRAALLMFGQPATAHSKDDSHQPTA